MTTENDLDDVTDLVDAVQQAISDDSLELIVLDYDDDNNEYLLRFTVNDTTHEVWFTTAFIERCFGEMAPPRFLVA